MGLKELLPSQNSNGATKRVRVDMSAQRVLEEIVNRRRRAMLLALEQQPRITVKELSGKIWELERSRRKSVPAEYSVHTSVKQNHMPRFADAELVKRADGPVMLTDRGESMAGIVRLIDSRTAGGDHS